MPLSDVTDFLALADFGKIFASGDNCTKEFHFDLSLDAVGEVPLIRPLYSVWVGGNSTFPVMSAQHSHTEAE